ncbi:hypothetical protein JOY44_28325 (plasmid) [Phormidium sp. CLA17]|nr:hypothetical protein [Leptolyngbya sp. Cla-17]MBM0745335.1 hypothetical protein [Leptolyngbya sp. Cla-17]
MSIAECYQWFLDEFSKAYSESLNLLQVDNDQFHKGKNLIMHRVRHKRFGLRFNLIAAIANCELTLSSLFTKNSNVCVYVSLNIEAQATPTRSQI